MKKIVILLISILLLSGCSMFSDDDLIIRKLNGGVDFSFLKGEDIAVLNWDYYLDKNGNVFDIVQDKNKTFANGEKFRVSEYLPYKYSYAIYTNDLYHMYIPTLGQYYCYSNSRFDECSSTIESSISDIALAKSGTVKQILDINEESDDLIRLYYISTDGKIYKNIYKTTYEDSQSITSFISSEVYLDNTVYGNILFATVGNYKDNHGSSIKRMLTDKGLYEWKKIDEEDSAKYEGLNEGYSFQLNKEYEKIKDRVLYNDLKMVLTSDYKAFNFIELIED